MGAALSENDGMSTYAYICIGWAVVALILIARSVKL